MTCTQASPDSKLQSNNQHERSLPLFKSNCRLAKQSAMLGLGITFSLILSACSSSTVPPVEPPLPPDDEPTGPTIMPLADTCEVSVQKQWVYNSMLDYYLFYDQVPNVNPESYGTPEELLRALRFEERDPYSHVRDAGTASLQFDEGREFGLGFRWGRDDDNAARLLGVATDSPFGRAGLERGDIIVGVDNMLWADISQQYYQENVFGSPDAPATSTWQIEKRDTGAIVNVDITTAEFQINSVLHSQYISNPDYSGLIGYLAFSSFLNTSRAELNTVFEDFNDRNITDLVLDLRYNGGGRVSIAEHLASLIAGNSHANELLYQYQYNDKYTANNYSLELQDNVGDLGLSRVIILTRGATASASEIVISGLQTHLEVVTIGSTTNGKPYIQRGRDRCGSRLNAIEAEGVNSAGVSVFGGIQAACFARDDRTRNFGIDTDTGKLEGMLESGLDYVVYGTCDTLSKQSAGLARTGRTDHNMIEETAKQGMRAINGAFR